MQKFKRIVLLAGEWETTPVVYNYLKEHTGVYKAIVEQPVSRKEFLKRRIKKQGLWPVCGQVLFQLLIAKPLSKTSKKRITGILETYDLKKDPIRYEEVIHLSSVN